MCNKPKLGSRCHLEKSTWNYQFSNISQKSSVSSVGRGGTEEEGWVRGERLRPLNRKIIHIPNIWVIFRKSQHHFIIIDYKF